jgi:hypothetical protein
MLEQQAVFDRRDAEGAKSLLLLMPDREPDRFQKQFTKAYVGEPSLIEIDTQREMIKLRAFAAIRTSDAGGKQRDSKSQGSKQRSKRSVQLVAEASTFLLNDLVDDRIAVENDASAGDVEVFEWDCKQVCAMKLAQSLSVGDCAVVVPDAFQIGVYVQHEYGSVKERAGARGDYTGSSSCCQPVSILGSAVRSMMSFSRTMRLLTGLERRARSALATRRMARVSSRLD